MVSTQPNSIGRDFIPNKIYIHLYKKNIFIFNGRVMSNKIHTIQNTASKIKKIKKNSNIA